MIPTLSKRSPQATPSPGKAPALLSQTDRLTPAPLSLSPREQQVCEYLSQGVSFEAIARHLSCSPAAARAYHRRALSKHQRTIALASLEQGDSYAPSDRTASATLEPAIAEQLHRRLASAPAALCERKLRPQNAPFHSPAVEAGALLERPSSLDLYLPSLFVTGESVTTGQKFSTQRSQFPQNVASKSSACGGKT